ncbi:MAG: hypothetical protein M3076_09705 [Actinomycetota bacterium]|nr:hypothetical protein [Actinomycetota bacterium]
MDEISTGLAFMLGTLGLLHIFMRFMTVPDARAARRSIAWGVGRHRVRAYLLDCADRPLADGLVSQDGGSVPARQPRDRLGPDRVPGCLVGTWLGRREQLGLESFDEVRVRSTTGLGEEVAPPRRSRKPREPGPREPVVAP